MTIKKVAFIGAGSMGAPMARRVRAAGLDVLICDLNQATLDAFAREGTATTSSAADCATADVIIVLLANDAQIESALTGERGVASAIVAGTNPVICMMSTTLPATLDRVRDPLHAAGARLIDAPISGGIVGAEKGTLSIMMGGDTEDVEYVRPVMEAMGERLFHCGALGSAEVIKIVNNMLCVANMFLTAEAVELAERYGVSFEQLSPILSVSTGLNFLTADAAIGRAQYAAWAHSEEAYESIHRIVSKDLHLALKLAEAPGLKPGLLQAIAGYVDSNDREAMVRWMHSGKAT